MHGARSIGRWVSLQVQDTIGLKRVAAGGTFSLALDGNGNFYVWGTDSGDQGVLAVAGPAAVCKPTQVGTLPFHQIVAGFQSAAAIGRLGRLAAWGWCGNHIMVCFSCTCNHREEHKRMKRQLKHPQCRIQEG
jgi:alpha-tubulin suppressor-like RCC1 family protein